MPVTHGESESVRGVVLAGGESSRFGAEGDDKALAGVGSEPVLGRIVAVLARVTDRRPVVAVRTPEQRARYADALRDGEVAFVRDDPEYEGPLAGIVGAAAAVGDPWLFCCGCDMPLLDERAVSWLLARLDRDRPAIDGGRVDAVAIEHPDGTLNPLHAVYRREPVASLHRLLPRTAGPRALLAGLESVHTVSPASVPDDVPLDRSTSNVNTRRQLESVREEFTRS
ncbi:molybdenum cofactor guanylyltransferase [Halorarum halobium]|uniref:molybdenum cofactor guanylyltransferase n=1 Tax=Halorarum halobium TaxID=3075121 RepID=UPI0028A85613|nr:molybdenum cofactor guanylyltransferase [Halobaculum sp. XH14]